MDSTRKELYTAKRSSGLKVNEDPNLASAIQGLRSDDDALNWLLMQVVDNKSLRLASSGSGGAGELIAHLDSSEIYYGALRCMVEGKVKFIHFYFVGENVPALRKGKASLNKSAAFSVVEAHGEIGHSSSLESLTAETIRQEIASLLRCRAESVVV